MAESDLNLLKSVVDENHAGNTADDAVNAILHLLRESTCPSWWDVYETIKGAYVGNAVWGDE